MTGEFTYRTIRGATIGVDVDGLDPEHVLDEIEEAVEDDRRYSARWDDPPSHPHDICEGVARVLYAEGRTGRISVRDYLERTPDIIDV